LIYGLKLRGKRKEKDKKTFVVVAKAKIATTTKALSREN
jgi:hypothetical protein